MELQGSVKIAAPLEKVWAALNDADVLRQCIPGCDEVRQISPEEMHARVQLRLGPVRAQFAGKVLLTDVRPQQGYTLNFEGSGGSAGFAKGSSVVQLQAVAQGTQLSYTAQAAVAGKLGQIGGRMIDATAQQLAGKFFANLQTHFAGDALSSSNHQIDTHANLNTHNQAAHQTAHQAAQSAQSAAPYRDLPRLVWFLAGVFATSVGVYLGAYITR